MDNNFIVQLIARLDASKTPDDLKKIEQFDTQYAEQYWKTKLKEIKHEETYFVPYS